MRLLQQPVIIASAPRSGSTLLRAILGSHTAVHAPHEIALTKLTVRMPPRTAATAGVRVLGWHERKLEHLLWDRLLHAELTRSGKTVIAHKSPLDVLAWQRLAECWPDARWVFLLRHPAAVAASWQKATRRSGRHAVERLARFMRAVTDARAALPGTTIRYEDLAAAPEQEVRRLCGALGLTFEPGMLAYGDHQAGPWRRGLGDWSATIASGRVQPARPIPATSSPLLRELAGAWGYGR